jgi:hypothetical protein
MGSGFYNELLRKATQISSSFYLQKGARSWFFIAVSEADLERES